MNLYLQRKETEILMHRLLWCAEWTDGTRHTLEDAVAFVLRVTAKREEQGKECDVWIEEIVDIPGDDWPHLRRLHA